MTYEHKCTTCSHLESKLPLHFCLNHRGVGARERIYSLPENYGCELHSVLTAPAPEPVPEPAPEPVPEPTPEPAPVPEPTPEPEPPKAAAAPKKKAVKKKAAAPKKKATKKKPRR